MKFIKFIDKVMREQRAELEGLKKGWWVWSWGVRRRVNGGLMKNNQPEGGLYSRVRMWRNNDVVNGCNMKGRRKDEVGQHDVGVVLGQHHWQGGW